MIEEIKNINDENEARRILMKLGNGLAQVEIYIKEWKEIKDKEQKASTITEKPLIAPKTKTVR